MIHITNPTDLLNKNNEETHANHERGKINRRMHAVLLYTFTNYQKRRVNHHTMAGLAPYKSCSLRIRSANNWSFPS